MECHAELFLCHEDVAVLDRLTSALDGADVGPDELVALTEGMASSRSRDNGERLSDSRRVGCLSFETGVSKWPKKWRSLRLVLAGDGPEQIEALVRFLRIHVPSLKAQAWGTGDEGPWEFFVKAEQGHVVKKDHEPELDPDDDDRALETVYRWWHAGLPAKIAVGYFGDRKRREKQPKTDRRKISAILDSYTEDSEERLAKLFQDGADPHMKFGGRSMVRIAVEREMPEMLRQLIARGAAFQKADSEGWTPLHSAAIGLSEACLQVLVEQGTDVNAKTRREKITPLHALVMKFQRPEPEAASLRMAQALVDRGADINALSSRGSVLWLAQQNNPVLARWLSEQGAPLVAAEGAYNGDLRGNLRMAIVHNDVEALKGFDLPGGLDPNDVEVVEWLVEYDAADVARELLADQAAPLRPFRDKPLILYAAEMYASAMVHWLFGKLDWTLPDVPQNLLGPLLVRVATLPESEGLMRELLDRGADIDYLLQTVDGLVTPLLRTIDKCLFARSHLLLDLGADPNLVSDEDDDCPLYRLARVDEHYCHGTDDLIAHLVSKGADPNVGQVDYQDTPLHAAARCGNDKAVAELLALGADSDRLNVWEERPIDCAKKALKNRDNSRQTKESCRRIIDQLERHASQA